MALTRSSERTTAVRQRREGAYLDAAEALVDEGARYADVAIAEIAERAGFSRASFYAYFSDKRALAVRIAERFGAELSSQVGGWLRGEDDGPLTAALERMISTFDDHRGAVLLLAEAAAYDDELALVWRGLHAEFEALVRGRLELSGGAAGSGGSGGSGGLDAGAFVLVWSTQAVIVEHLRSGRLDRDELTRSLALAWNGVLGES